MTWPQGAGRYVRALPPSSAGSALRVPGRRSTTRCGSRRARSSPSPTSPWIGGGLKIAPDAVVDDGLLDVVVAGPFTKPGVVKIFPGIYRRQARRPSRGRHRPQPVGAHRAADRPRAGPAGGVRGRRAHRPAAAARHGRSRGVVRPLLSARRAMRRRGVCLGCAGGIPLPEIRPAVLVAEREHAARGTLTGGALRRGQAPGRDRPQRARPVPRARSASRSTTSRSRRARRWSGGAACWSPRRPAPARPWSASSPCTSRSQRAARRSTRRRSRRCPTRSTPTWSAATAPTRSVCSPATPRSTATRRWSS